MSGEQDGSFEFPRLDIVMAIADEFGDLAHFGRLLAAWVEPHSNGAVGGLPRRPISSIVYSSNMNKNDAIVETQPVRQVG